MNRPLTYVLFRTLVTMVSLAMITLLFLGLFGLGPTSTFLHAPAVELWDWIRRTTGVRLP